MKLSNSGIGNRGKRMGERIRDNQGFTLIEIVIAIALAGIISVALLAGIQFAVKTMYAGRDYMQSNYAVQGDLDEYIGSKDVSTASSQTISFEWEDTTADGNAVVVPDFTVSGYRLDKTSSKLHLNETFKAYVSSTITPQH